MRCHVMCSHMTSMSSVVKWCDAMGWDLMSLWCDVAGCDVTLCGSKWLCDVVNWKMIWWSVLQSITPYYTVPQITTQYYKVLQSTTPYHTVLQNTIPRGLTFRCGRGLWRVWTPGAALREPSSPGERPPPSLPVRHGDSAYLPSLFHLAPSNKATNFTQTPKKNKNEFWNCHLAMLGRVAKPIFTSLCPGQPLRVWACEWTMGFKKWSRLRAIGY